MKLYDELASWWPVLSPPEEYMDEAAFYVQLLDAAGPAGATTLLELGSGGGHNAFHLKTHFTLTLVDAAPAMLEQSRTLNSECEHVQADMRTVRSNRSFDLVFVHDAIVYMTSLEDLRRALETAFVHCRPGGVALFAADYIRETFREASSVGGSEARTWAMRYLEWCWDPDPADTQYTVDYAYLMRQEDGTVRVEHDRHIEGLFPRELWLTTLRDVGFEPEMIPSAHGDCGNPHCEVFLARRPMR